MWKCSRVGSQNIKYKITNYSIKNHTNHLLLYNTPIIILGKINNYEI